MKEIQFSNITVKSSSGIVYKARPDKHFLENISLIPKDVNNIMHTTFKETEKTSTKFLEILNNGEINVNEADVYGWSYLHYAAVRNNSEIIEALLAKGADIEARNIDMETPLFLAVHFENIEAVRTLLKHNANKDVVNKLGNHLLYIAKRLRNKDINSVLNLETEEKVIDIYKNEVIEKMIKDYRLHMSKKELDKLDMEINRELSTRLEKSR